MNDCMLSSKKMDWRTPAGFYNKLDEEFHFVVDAASSAENHKAPIFYTKETDGLKQNWKVGPVFCNPPYGREIGKWVKKAYEEHEKWGTKIVMLIPARTDTQWFHDYIYHKAEVRFVRGRIKFWNDYNQPNKDNAPFPSMVVIFGGDSNA